MKASVMEFERPAPNSVSLTGKTSNRIQHAARLQGTAEQLRRTGFLRDFGVGDGQDGRFNPTAGGCDSLKSPVAAARGVRSLSVSAVACVIQLLQLCPVSF